MKGIESWEEFDVSTYTHQRAAWLASLPLSDWRRRSRPAPSHPTTRSRSSPADRIPISRPGSRPPRTRRRISGSPRSISKCRRNGSSTCRPSCVESLAAQGYKAFGIFPGDAVGINSTVSELKSAGIPSAALAGCAQDPTDVAFCLGTDVYNSAYLGTKHLIKAMGGKGNIVHLAGLLVDPNTTLRVKAVETAVGETNGAVKLLQTVADTDAQEAADQKINALLAGQKDQIDGMIATGYIPSVVASKSLRTLGDKRIKFVGIDDDPIVLDAIKDGFVAGTMAQNPYGQGYIGAYVLDLLASGTCTMKDDAPWIKTPQTAHFIDFGHAGDHHRQYRQLQGRSQEDHRRHPGLVQGQVHDLQVRALTRLVILVAGKARLSFRARRSTKWCAADPEPRGRESLRWGPGSPLCSGRDDSCAARRQCNDRRSHQR